MTERFVHIPQQGSRSEDTLPTGWRRARLGELCDLVNGDAYRDTDWSLSGIPIIRIQNLNDASKTFNHWAGPLDDRVVVNTGDVLLAWSGTPGTSFGAHRWDRGLAVLNQHIFRVDIDSQQVDPDWAVFAINEQLDEMIGKAHGGVGLRHVTRREVDGLRILFPQLAEQKRIAGILKEQMAAVERARLSAEAQLQAAESLPAAYLRAVFNSPEAQAWPKKRLEEVCELLPAKSIVTFGDSEVMAITTACLTEMGFRPSGIKLARMWSEDAAECLVSNGEILIARSNTPELVGRVAMFAGQPKGAVASDLTIRIRCRNGFEPRFMAGYLSWLYLSGYWKERAGGASGSMKKITRTQIQNEQLPTPSDSDQRRIAAQLSLQMVSAEMLRRTVAEQLDAIHKLPAALLRAAFSGRV